MSLVPKDWSKEILKAQEKSKLRFEATGSSVVLNQKELANLSRPVTKTSFYYYQLYKNIWYWSFITLVVDLILLVFLPLAATTIFDQYLTDRIINVILALVLTSSVWFFKEFLISKISNLENIRGSVFELLNKRPWLVLLVFGLFLAFELLSKVSQTGLLAALVVGMLLFFSSLTSLRKAVEANFKKHQNYKYDLTLQVEAFNKIVFFLHLIPLLSSRIIIFISCISLPLSSPFNPYFLLFACFGCVLLSLMQSEEKFFMIHCQRCGSKTSRFLAKHKECLGCINN